MKIIKIEPSKHKRGRVLVHTEEGDLLRISENELLRFALFEGMVLSEGEAEILRAAARKSMARATGAAMASRRMMSRKEVTDRLQRKGVEADEAQETADWLRELGAVDDLSYGGVLARHYASQLYGPGRLRQELQRHGIPRELWEECLAQLPPEQETILKYLQKKWPKGIADGRKVAAALQRRGFGYGEIRRALSEYGQKMEDEL